VPTTDSDVVLLLAVAVQLRPLSSVVDPELTAAELQRVATEIDNDDRVVSARAETEASFLRALARELRHTGRVENGGAAAAALFTMADALARRLVRWASVAT
jgi:hypothetical protein